MCADSTFLLGNDWRQDAVDRSIQALHHRMMLIQAAAVHAHDDLRTGRVERSTLERLDRLAADLPVEMTSARRSLVATERGLVRGAPGQDEQPAESRGTGRAERNWIGRAANRNSRRHVWLDHHLLVKQQRSFRVGLNARLCDQCGGVARQLEPKLALRIGKDRTNLYKLGYKPAQARVSGQTPQRERYCHARTAHVDAKPLHASGTDRLVDQVSKRVRRIADRRKEPGLDRTAVSHPLDPPAALRKPDVA